MSLHFLLFFHLVIICLHPSHPPKCFAVGKKKGGRQSTKRNVKNEKRRNSQMNNGKTERLLSVLKLGETTKETFNDIYEMHYIDTEQISAGSPLLPNWAVWPSWSPNPRLASFPRYSTDMKQRTVNMGRILMALWGCTLRRQILLVKPHRGSGKQHTTGWKASRTRLQRVWNCSLI